MRLCDRYKQYNTRAALSFLTDFDLEKAGVAEKDLRKQIIMALKKAGYKGNATAGKSKAGPSRQNSASNKTNPDPNVSNSKPFVSLYITRLVYPFFPLVLFHISFILWLA